MRRPKKQYYAGRFLNEVFALPSPYNSLDVQRFFFRGFFIYGFILFPIDYVAVNALQIYHENGAIQSHAWWLVCTVNGNILYNTGSILF